MKLRDLFYADGERRNLMVLLENKFIHMRFFL